MRKNDLEKAHPPKREQPRAIYFAPDGRRLPDGPVTMQEFIDVLWRDAQIRIKLELKDETDNAKELRGEPEAEVRD